MDPTTMNRRARNVAKSKQVAPEKLPVLKRELTKGEAAEVRALRQRLVTSPNPPSLRLGPDDKVTLQDDRDDDELQYARLVAALGATDAHAVTLLLNQAASATPGNDADRQCNTALAVLSGIRPRDEVEGMLAVQMIGSHNLAMTMLRRAGETDRVDFMATYGNLAAKLLRTFTLQVEALARKRGQIRQQTVRVEHVTVEAGGQAVVGAVATQPSTDDRRK
jgi:hypothetical protein